jgi:site-specific recombinase XerD
VFRSVDRHGRVGSGMSDRAVADVVKLYAERAGLDPAAFAGHSLRAGFVTSAAERGARAERIMDHTGHRSVAMVRIYTRRADAFADHAGTGLL